MPSGYVENSQFTLYYKRKIKALMLITKANSNSFSVKHDKHMFCPEYYSYLRFIKVPASKHMEMEG